MNSLASLFFRRKNTPYEIYTDGSAKKNRGSWAYVIVHNGRVLREDSGKVLKTSSNHMEFQAALEALQSLPVPSQAILFSDSRLLIDAATLWIPEWKAQGWVKKRGQPIPRVEQMQALDRLLQQHYIQWQWIKAHAGIEFNERCDWLCLQARSF